VVSFVLVQRIGFDGALYGSITGNVVGTSVCYVMLRRRASGESWLRPAFRPALVCVLLGLTAGLVIDRIPAIESSWFVFLITSSALAVLLAAGLVAVMPRAVRAEGLGIVRRRRVATPD
jgi:hypothetical protein